ncbi:effector-associated constant component EACC1 [Klebsiella variicola]|uniref:effector-associated constant component EACC1 n=1 Tax=Klebsiella variicola TaxID=244366 RepID=UPI0015A739B8|nr:hypothetical protein [Klebsiella variicola]HBU2832580.1 hypothetical protein [Klebsiella pneumoniae]HBU3058609.1 hypothetical protein [Klebsiella pneumoniae]
MPNSETFIKLPPVIGEAVLPTIRKTIPKDEFRVQKRIQTFDSYQTGLAGTLVDITIIVVTSSPACFAIASIVRAWIKTRSSKKFVMTTEKGKYEIENLDSKELMEIIKQCKEISIKEK